VTVVGTVDRAKGTRMLRCPPMPTTTAKRARLRAGWTYAGYCRIPADGRRHEILDGRHYVAPAPDTYHQAVTLRLASRLLGLIGDAGLGEVFVSPIDLHLAPGTIVQPDVLAVATANRGIIGVRKISGRPELVVEVLSATPSSRRRDRRLKLARYERAGVPEYLIVDPRARAVEQFVLAGGCYGAPRRCTQRVELASFPGVAVALRTIW
jgi:Uma2 family endonuclease